MFIVNPLNIPLFKTNPSVLFKMSSAAKPIGLGEPIISLLVANAILGKPLVVPVIIKSLPLSI